MPELRKDPVIGRWVIIATERAKRPDDFAGERGLRISKGFCPFCVGNEGKTPPEVYSVRESGEPNTPGWKVRVVPNKFPALVSEGETHRIKEGIYQHMNGVGRHEVIIETPEHTKFLYNMSSDEIKLVVETYRERYLALKKDKRLRYILIFKNYGSEAGASLSHSHSQIIATPIVPKRVSEELYGARNFFSKNNRCVFCSVIEREIGEGRRIVFRNKHFIAFTPYASRFPFEVWILPLRHSAFFEEINDKEIEALTEVFMFLFKRYYNVLNDPAYNFIIHTAPTQMSGKWPSIEFDYHWHIEVIPKLTRVAGFEWGTGFYINPMPPENASEFLRE